MSPITIYSPAELYKIARNQRRILLLVLCWALIFILFPMTLPHGFSSVLSAVGAENYPIENNPGANGLMWSVAGILIFSLIGIVPLALLFSALYGRFIWLIFVCILLFLPYVSIVVLLIGSWQATRVLRNAGYSVGLLGVSQSTLRTLRKAATQAPPPTIGTAPSAT